MLTLFWPFTFNQFICHGDSLALWEDVATIIYAANAQVARSMNSAFVHASVRVGSLFEMYTFGCFGVEKKVIPVLALTSPLIYKTPTWATNWQAQLTDKYPKYALSTQKSAVIDYPKGDIGRSLRAKQCTFWDSLVEL